MRDPRDIILEPILTEKADFLRRKHNMYTFKVAMDATKPEIKRAVEQLFEVHVERVRTQIVKGKPRRRWGRVIGKRSNWKKAICKLREGETIPIFEMGGGK